MRCSSRASEEAMVLPGSMQDQERNMQNPEACNFAPPGVAGDGLVASHCPKDAEHVRASASARITKLAADFAFAMVS